MAGTRHVKLHRDDWVTCFQSFTEVQTLYDTPSYVTQEMFKQKAGTKYAAPLNKHGRKCFLHWWIHSGSLWPAVHPSCVWKANNTPPSKKHWGFITTVIHFWTCRLFLLLLGHECMWSKSRCLPETSSFLPPATDKPNPMTQNLDSVQYRVKINL